MHLVVDSRGYVSESISYRVKGEKNPKSKRVNIGKMSADGEFVPNAYFRERKAKEELEEVKEELKKMKETSEGGEKKEKETVNKAVSSGKKEGKKGMSEEDEKLEIKISYLERENGLLNEIVTDLNKRFGVLSAQFEELKKKVKDLMENESEERESRRPPHY